MMHHHDEELDRSLSPTPVRSPSASPTSRPSSPVSSIAGDGKGPVVVCLCNPFLCYFLFVIGSKKTIQDGRHWVPK